MPKLLFNDFKGWRTGKDFTDVTLTQVSLDSNPNKVVALVYFGHVNLDFDGSPTAYGPLSANPDDSLGNAGNAEQGWFGVASADPGHDFVRSGLIKIDDTAPGFHKGGNATLPKEFPVFQQTKFGDPKDGFYVSTTPRNLEKSLGKITAFRQNSFVDASKIAYGALDQALQAEQGVRLGDFGLALRHDQDRQSGFSFVDAGDWKHALGECSHRVGKDLGVTKLSPGRWNNNFPVSFILFPGSAIWTPHSTDPIPIPPAWGDTVISNAVTAIMKELARAENAHDLPLLMANNESSPAGVTKGKAGLDAFRKAKGAHAWIPGTATTIMLGLARYGFLPPKPRPLIM